MNTKDNNASSSNKPTSEEYDEAASALIDRAKKNGVASLGTGDGRLFMFTREKLQELLANAKGGMVTIFIQSHDLRNLN
jgi:hypothetical protein